MMDNDALKNELRDAIAVVTAMTLRDPELVSQLVVQMTGADESDNFRAISAKLTYMVMALALIAESAIKVIAESANIAFEDAIQELAMRLESK